MKYEYINVVVFASYYEVPGTLLFLIPGTRYQVGSKAPKRTRKWYSRIRFPVAYPGRY